MLHSGSLSPRDVGRVKPAAPVDGIKPSDTRSRCSQEDRVRADAIPVDCCGCLQIIDKQQAKLGDDVHQTIFVTDLHCNWEVISKFGREEQLSILL